jgi:hypothetical protein
MLQHPGDRAVICNALTGEYGEEERCRAGLARKLQFAASGNFSRRFHVLVVTSVLRRSHICILLGTLCDITNSLH